ncbi:ATP-binding cassette domain-containing protein [Azospirillum sp. RWY-5-1]|uniref:ATP-binding cassette domain-containing protein n=1 Tax=Azospirillum oleiclasticum TaxID=2735135 RepID=A0ABX2TM85_9PROT|nr:ATP-binding cassette domain-containing protein [Azospirillum oleiclasticum]NYZ14570.1 ATP-binding cassette domain-containing protein [Azospirillum oleiclasticum]NYZ24348.1 ATP-binding cassette domain-containing protein [Azospirillum oleiclasticum]
MSSPAKNPALYELDAVRFSAGGRAILSGLSLRLEQGRIYGLVGPNGSGKSTLIRMLARQQPPSGGSIRCLGAGIASIGDRDFARSVAYMPQFTPPAEGMTVRELVALGRFPWHGALGRFGALDAAKVAEAMADTRLDSFADRLVDSLSGGERQRVWLAMMLAQDTRCLLLDEPTSALDIASQVEMLGLVRRLGHARGIGAVIVLHDINMAARVCDEILAMRGGTLIAQGAPAAIMTSETLEAIYHVAMGIVPHPGTGEPIGYVL